MDVRRDPQCIFSVERLNVSSEIIQNGLPTRLLRLFGVFFFGIKCFRDFCSTFDGCKSDFHVPAIFKRIFN